MSDHLIQWPMKNDSCMQSRMGMGVTENMEVADGTYKELMSVIVIRHVLNLTLNHETSMLVSTMRPACWSQP